MKDYNGEIEYKEKKYKLVFDFNVMSTIQEEYGSFGKWADLVDGENDVEPNVKAVIFGYTEMLNEGIEIENEKNGTNIKPFATKEVGRMISEIGLRKAVNSLNQTVIESTKNEEKN